VKWLIIVREKLKKHFRCFCSSCYAASAEFFWALNSTLISGYKFLGYPTAWLKTDSSVFYSYSRRLSLIAKDYQTFCIDKPEKSKMNNNKNPFIPVDNWFVETAFLFVPFVIVLLLIWPSIVTAFGSKETHGTEATAKVTGQQWL
jgi:hypothetical protein